MYTEISSNKTKSVALIFGFLIFIVALGWLLAYAFDRPFLLPLAIIIAVVQAFISYFYSDTIALSTAGAQEAPRQEPFLELHRLVENLAITAGVPKPRVYVINDAAPNAFATGRDPQHASIAVTTGLMDRLDKAELEGVIAHELSHIGNYDIRVMTIVVVLVGVVSLLTDMFLRSMWFGGGRRNNRSNDEGGQIMMVVGIVALILAPIAASLIQLAVSRKREYLADASGALLTRYPEGLARALEKISQDPAQLKNLSSATNHLYIEDPVKNKQSWLTNLFSTHPPIVDRIQKLREMGSHS